MSVSASGVGTGCYGCLGVVRGCGAGAEKEITTRGRRVTSLVEEDIADGAYGRDMAVIVELEVGTPLWELYGWMLDGWGWHLILGIEILKARRIWNPPGASFAHPPHPKGLGNFYKGFNWLFRSGNGRIMA
jgi:hypothetical protein